MFNAGVPGLTPLLTYGVAVPTAPDGPSLLWADRLGEMGCWCRPEDRARLVSALAPAVQRCASFPRPCELWVDVSSTGEPPPPRAPGRPTVCVTFDARAITHGSRPPRWSGDYVSRLLPAAPCGAATIHRVSTVHRLPDGPDAFFAAVWLAMQDAAPRRRRPFDAQETAAAIAAFRREVAQALADGDPAVCNALARDVPLERG